MSDFLHRGFDPLGGQFEYWEADRFDPAGLQYTGSVPFGQLIDITVVDIDEFRSIGDFTAAYIQYLSADLGVPTENLAFFGQVDSEAPIVYTSAVDVTTVYNISGSNQSDLQEFFEV